MSILPLFSSLSAFDEYLWSYFAIPMILFFGIFLSFKFRFIQIRKFPVVVRTFYELAKSKDQGIGAHPIKVFFASIGGCIGIGNIVAVCTAVQIGGPGAVFWMWVAGLIGMIIKYSEIYLGIVHRIPNAQGGYDGGPMYYLKKVIKSPIIPVLFAVLLAIYGTEVYMFNVMTHSIVENWHLNHYLVIAGLLLFIVYTSSGGIARVGKVSSLLIPFFLIIYCGMGGWILLANFAKLPGLILLIFKSAFTGYAPIGGFAGSGILLTMSQGIARGCYSGDIGVGYASIVHAEARNQDPKRQAQLSILGIFLDTFVVCTFTTLLILVTGVWHQDVPASMMVQKALEHSFCYMNFFMPLFLFLLGYSSLIAFFFVGLKCANYLHPKGKYVYYAYAMGSFVLFSFVPQTHALTLMSIIGAALLCINLFGIYRWRKEIEVF
ncbi:MAG: AGCS family amino acid carrier protein [Simkaniaceae bacterium]